MFCLHISHFSVFPERRGVWGSSISLPVCCTGLLSHGPSWPSQGNCKTPHSEIPANSTTMQEHSSSLPGEMEFIQELDWTDKYLCLGLWMAKGAREMGWITVSRISLQGFLSSSLFIVEWTPSQQCMSSSGSRVVLWAEGSAGCVTCWLCFYSA